MPRTRTLVSVLFLAAMLATAPSLFAMAAANDLAIFKDDGQPAVTPGGMTTYTITATNLGAATEMATVTDMFPPTLTCTWTCTADPGSACTANGMGDINDSVTLAAAGSVTYTVDCTISLAAVGTLSNTATIASDDPGNMDPDLTNNSSTDTNTVTPQADLSITKDDGVTEATPGLSTTYTIVASNAGPNAVTGATVVDDFPDFLTCTWTCAASAGSSCTAAGAGSINDGAVNLLAGGTATYTAMCDIDSDANGALINIATISSLFADPDDTNNTADDTDTLVASSDLSITAMSTPDPVAPGEEVMINVTVSNAGPSDAMNVVVTTTLPAGLTFDSTTGCTEDPNGVPTCTLGDIPADGNAMFTIVATADDTGDQNVQFAVDSDSDDPTPGNDTETETVTVSADVPLTEIPTAGELGLLLMGLLMAAGATWTLRR